MPPSATTTSAARRRTHRWSVRAHLAVIFVTAVVLAAAALGYGYAWSADRARDDAIAAMRAQAQIGAREIADTLALGLEQVDEVAAQPGLAAAFATPEGCRLVVSGSEAFAVAHLAVVSPAGQVGCSSRPGLAAVDTRPYQGADWLRESLAARDVVVRWPADDAVADEPAIVAARSFGAGTVALLLGSRTVADTLAASQALPADAGIVVVDRETGRVVSSSDPALAAPGSTAFAGRPATGQWDGADHEPRLIASADVEAVPWRVHAALDRASVTASARGTLERQALTAAVALLALLAALVLLERRVAGPLAALTRAAVRARDDAGTARVPEAGTAELATLARAFNAMLDIRAGQEARLAHGASHDRLTGLPNTEAFRAAVDAALETGPRPDLVVLCVGLDRFQAVSDGIGPDGAERLLVEVAARLRATVRPGDVLARGDGERFFVACEGLGAHGAVELAERLHLAVEEPMGWPTTGVALQVSTGIAVAAAGTSGTGGTAGTAGTGAAAAEDLVRRSATAMGDAQARARTWSIFDDSMHVLAAHQLQTEQGLREALAGDQLVVHYQPIVDTVTGRLRGAEALVRWDHPERGLVPPLEFIGVAERTGQIDAIGRLVLRRACEEAVRWAPAEGPFTMSVNVAAEQLLDDGFADLVADVLGETGLPPRRLCLEVTESTVIRRSGSGAQNLHRLRAMGVNVAVDDFGTGYSSLSYLKNLPITSLKIDRSFITRIEHDPRDRHLVEAVLGMARALGLAVVAEGVETDGQRRLLEDLGCESSQGFLFGRPCRTEDFAALVHLRESPAAA